ncbi:MAG: hypothetical protein HRU03_05970 [Nanoarchaeales archaeon]|nr:hypothetical protein [Nanoarchaeales archaeon]
MEVVKNNGQINLKLPRQLMSFAEEYADYHGYTNVQELIRDTLRKTVINEEVREDYMKQLLADEKKNDFLGEKESKKFLLEMGKKALEYKNEQ